MSEHRSVPRTRETVEACGPAEPIDAVVIGGGQAGLAASRHLARRGIEHVVLERRRIGETWRTQRWDGFALNTPGVMNRMPDDPPGGAPDAGPDDGFQLRDAWVARLEGYAARHALPVREGVAVASVRSDGSRFTVSVRAAGEVGAGEEREEGAGQAPAAPWSTRGVIVASGAQTVPLLPSFAADLPTGIDRLSAATYRRAEALRPGAVLVVGSAQSGVQVAEDLLEHGREVHLCTSAVPRVPRRYRGRDIFTWLDGAGWWRQTADRLPDPRMLTAKNPTISGVGRLGHTVSLQGLAARGARLLGRPRGIAGWRLLVDDTLGANIAFGDRTSAEVKANVDAAIRDRGLAVPPPEDDPADLPHPDPSSVRSPAELDLERAGIGTVIFATGFTADLGYLPAEWLDDRGEPRHVRAEGAVPGLACIGWRWMISRSSSLIHGTDEDGGLAADIVARHLATG